METGGTNKGVEMPIRVNMRGRVEFMFIEPLETEGMALRTGVKINSAVLSRIY